MEHQAAQHQQVVDHVACEEEAVNGAAVLVAECLGMEILHVRSSPIVKYITQDFSCGHLHYVGLLLSAVTIIE